MDEIGEEPQFNEQVCKAWNEYKLIVELEYVKAKINGSSKVIIVKDRKVKHSDLPQPFKNKQKFNNEDDNFF